MKEKTRITIMLGTLAAGAKMPLAGIGKPKKPKCFDLGEPQLPYMNQRNTWFDHNICKW